MDIETVFEIIVLLLGIISFTFTGYFLRRKNQRAGIIFSLITLILSIVFIISLIILNFFLALILILYVIFAFWIGTYNYKRIKIKKIELESEKIKAPIKMLFAADFQFDKRQDNVNEKALENSIKAINNNLDNVDLLLLGGDYVNYKNHIDDFFKTLQTIKKPKNSFAITGNHDHVDLDEIKEQLKKQNYKVFLNDFDNVTINGNDIQIAGVEDFWLGNSDVSNYYNELDPSLLTILLSHNPDYFDYVDRSKIDLVLSGHYHKGQVQLIPGLPFSRIATKYNYGYFKKDNTLLYVTSGLGGSFLRGKLGIYTRYFARSEVVLITITPENKKTK